MIIKNFIYKTSLHKINPIYNTTSLTNLKILPYRLFKISKKEFSNDDKMILDKKDIPIYKQYQRIVREIKKMEKIDNNLEDKLVHIRKFTEKLSSLNKYKECLDFDILEEFFLNHIEKLNDNDFYYILACFAENKYVGKDNLIWLRAADEICKRDLEFNKVYPILDVLSKLEAFKKDKLRTENVIKKLDTYNLQDVSSIILLLSYLVRGGVNYECNLWRKYIPFLIDNLKFDFQYQSVKDSLKFFEVSAICSMYALMNGVSEFNEIVEKKIKNTIFLNLKILEINSLVDFIFTLSILGKINERDLIKILILCSTNIKIISSLMLTKLKVLILYFYVSNKEFQSFISQSKIGLFTFPDESSLTEFKEQFKIYKDCENSVKYQFFINYVMMYQDSLISTMLDATYLKL